MRILQVHNAYLSEGGEDRLVSAEAAALRGIGCEVIPAHTGNPAQPAQQAFTLALAPWNPISARSMAKTIEVHRPDIAHVHNVWYRWTPSVVTTLRRLEVPVVMTVHNFRLICANALFFRDGHPCTDCLGTHPWRAVQHRCYHRSAPQSIVAAGTIAVNRSLGTWRGVTLFIAPTRFVADKLVDAAIPANRIEVVPSLIPDPGPRLGPPSASTTVLYTGRLDRGKGLDVLLAAWATTDLDLELVIVGDGPLRAELEERRPPRTRFVGWVGHTELEVLLRSARALVFPSRFFETFGLSLGEALASGLPVIAGDVGSRREVLGDEGAGWLVTADSVEEWGASLAGLGNDAAVDAAGTAARARYRRLHAPDVALPMLRAAYEKALVSS